MKVGHLAAVLAAALLSACAVSLSAPTPPDATPAFVTATLPATRTPVTTATATATITGTPGLSVTAPPNCKDAAVLMQDVTIPAGTNITPGEKFTKTWQFRNTGTCPWVGYRIAFV